MILVAVNSRTVRMQVERMLQGDGLVVVGVGSLAERRIAVAGKSFTGVVLDDSFPDGTGAELLGEMQRESGTKPIVISVGGAEGVEADVVVAKGAIMTDLLPALRGEMARRRSGGNGSESTGSSQDRGLGRILVVDDSRTYREMLRVSLESAGYSVRVAETGEEGVRCALEQPPDAMLVDSMLPGISGPAVIRRVRGEAATRRTPCVLLTASEDAAQELDALEAGADTFVRKDEAIGIILARLAGVLRSASTPAATSLAALPQLPRRVALVGEPGGALAAIGVLLLEEGCETMSLLPAEATLERCAALGPDLLLYAAAVDAEMLGFCREFKTLPGSRYSRLVLLDTAAGRNDAAAAIQAGADDYLPAASDRTIVLARAKSQLRRKRVEDENRGLREHIIRQESEAAAQRALAEAKSQHAEEMRVAYGVAEQKAHEAERARLELEQITEGIPQIVWTSDARGGTVKFNRRWTDFTGLPKDGITHSVWRRAIHKDDVKRAMHDWGESFREGLPYTSEYRLQSVAGIFRWFLVRAIPLVDEAGRIDRWFGTCTDVHDQKLSEEALRRTEKLAATGRLAASIAHEINNPLESVTNLLYLIEMNVRSDKDTHGYALTAQKELDRVAQISKKTLSFYRESTNAAAVDLGALVTEVEDIYSVRLERKEIRLEVECELTRKPNGLAGELRQVISNLVTNAIDASPEKTVIRVRLRDAHRWVGDEEPGVRVTVGDLGHGIPADVLADLFKPFVTTKGQKGTGLGLWLSQSIVRRHGGTMRVRSSTAVGRQGTCFSVFLPMVTPEAQVEEADSMGSMLRVIGKELLKQE